MALPVIDQKRLLKLVAGRRIDAGVQLAAGQHAEDLIQLSLDVIRNAAVGIMEGRQTNAVIGCIEQRRATVEGGGRRALEAVVDSVVDALHGAAE